MQGLQAWPTLPDLGSTGRLNPGPCCILDNHSTSWTASPAPDSSRLEELMQTCHIVAKQQKIREKIGKWKTPTYSLTHPPTPSSLSPSLPPPPLSQTETCFVDRPGRSGIHYVVLAILKLMAILPLSPKCYDYRFEPVYLSAKFWLCWLQSLYH